MKLSTFNAAAIVMALAASSVQAASIGSPQAATIIYDVTTPTDPANTVSYGSQSLGSLGTQTVDGWGDYIGFADVYPRHVTKATFWLSTNLASDPGLTLYIYDDAFAGSWSTTWDDTGALFEYSFAFSTPLPVVPDKIEYLLVLNDPTVLGSDYLNIATSTTTVGTDEIDTDIGAGEVLVGYTPGQLAVAPLNAGGTIAARFEAVPEPATLALLSLGLVGLGYTRRRKTVG